jgi:hypothetical protein
MSKSLKKFIYSFFFLNKHMGILKILIKFNEKF